MKPKSLPPKNETSPASRGKPGHRPPTGSESRNAADRESSRPGESGTGKDPFVESGLPEHDPERPRQTPEQQSTD